MFLGYLTTKRSILALLAGVALATSIHADVDTEFICGRASYIALPSLQISYSVNNGCSDDVIATNV